MGKQHDALLAIVYFNICLNPYEEFRDISFDFNKFYEDQENLTDAELNDLIAKKYK
jgi:serine/threonine-protein kinase ULK/ATG1